MSENYVKVEIWVLHSQFTNSHFHLHITVQMKTLNGASVSQNPLLHSCCVHTHPSCAELNSAQSNMLHSQFTITTHLYQLSVYLNGENKVCPQEPNHTSYIFIGVHFLHHHFASTYPINSIQLALVPPVECYSYCKCYPLQYVLRWVTWLQFKPSSGVSEENHLFWSWQVTTDLAEYILQPAAVSMLLHL
jgi:hypothetical protein